MINAEEMIASNYLSIPQLSALAASVGVDCFPVTQNDYECQWVRVDGSHLTVDMMKDMLDRGEKYITQ